MSGLSPIAFDIETTGLGPAARVTVAGFATGEEAWLVLNTDGDRPDGDSLQSSLESRADQSVNVVTELDEAGLLQTLRQFTNDHVDTNHHYLCAYNGERWRDGFDLPFLRTVCARHDFDWPFDDVAYADVRSMVERFNTGEATDLESVYAELLGGCCQDPFDESEAAIDAYWNADWLPLLRHNLADLVRTLELAALADRYVPKSDFNMKNLGPP